MADKNIDSKQGKQDTEFVKEKRGTTDEYVFQKNKITKTGVIIIVAILALLIIGVLVSGVFFGTI